MTSEREFRLGLIGCGDIAVGRHLPALTQSPRVRLLAVCDADLERASATAKQFDVPRHCRDHRELLSDEEIEAVVVATPPWVTPHIAVAALRAGKDVLAEKPMALTLEDAQRVVEAERETGRLVQIGFTYRHGPLIDALRDWIAAGRLGSPLVIRLGVFDETWAPEADPEHYARLMATLRHGPPCIHDGAHSADHLHFLTGSQAVRISAFGLKSRPEFPATNYNVAHIEFENGDVARLEIGWFYPHFPRGEFEIMGPEGIAYFDRASGESVLKVGTVVERVRLEDDYVSSCFAIQLEKFVRSIAERTPPVPGTREGMASLRLTMAFERSMNERRPIAIEANEHTQEGDGI